MLLYCRTKKLKIKPIQPKFFPQIVHNTRRGSDYHKYWMIEAINHVYNNFDIAMRECGWPLKISRAYFAKHNVVNAQSWLRMLVYFKQSRN